MSVCRVVRTAIPALLALAVIVPEAAAAARGGSPAAPTNLRITATTSSSVTLAWDAPKSGSEISYYGISETPSWNHFTVKAPQTTFTRARLSPNVTHSWVVRAVDTKGNSSPASNTVAYKTPPDTTPPSAATLSALYVGPRLVELDWTDSVDDTSSRVNYLVNVNGSSTPYGNLSHAVVPLKPSTSHSISVTARDNSGNGATSNTISVTTPTADNTSPPSPPGNLSGFAVANCEGWLSWDASTDDVDPPSVIRYEAYVNGQFDSSWFGNTSTFVYATQNGTNTFTIVAFDSSGNQSASSVEIHDMWLC
jgi:fibronectin type 3 domain-containing protein